ncbi:MAG: hypothetical protein KJP03_02300, partial [Gammaproteobacteria bacterium]|nr:hypothetical protein [Gammaproteobacteria bacterium]
AAFYTGSAAADTLLIEGISPDASAGQPARGASKADVRAQLGEPVSETGAVGQPPISSWEYDGFVVYFEYDFVLHSVAKR